jgi:hypothetical protein
MASGDTLLILTPLHGVPTATLYAAFDTMTGASTPAEAIPVLAFDQTTQQYMDFPIVIPRNYASGGFTCTIAFSARTTTGGVRWGLAFRRVQDDAEDLDTTAHTYDYNEVSDTTLPSVQGEVNYAAITFTDGADADSVAVGEMAILRLTRVVGHGDDTAAALVDVHRIEIKET